MCLFEVISYPGWQKHGALDWTIDTFFAVVALAGLIAAIIVLAARLRNRVPGLRRCPRERPSSQAYYAQGP